MITGFGRLGAPFAADWFGVKPDILTMAKAITNAAVPMGAVAASREIYDTIVEAADAPIELFHGYTSGGHPLACAAALASPWTPSATRVCSSAPPACHPAGRTPCTASRAPPT